MEGGRRWKEERERGMRGRRKEGGKKERKEKRRIIVYVFLICLSVSYITLAEPSEDSL